MVILLSRTTVSFSFYAPPRMFAHFLFNPQCSATPFHLESHFNLLQMSNLDNCGASNLLKRSAGAWTLHTNRTSSHQPSKDQAAEGMAGVCCEPA
jgi:hypothetical protein